MHYKYEKLGDFCFICGVLLHTERFYKKKLDADGSSITREWEGWLRAPSRRCAGGGKSKWLRDEYDGDWGCKDGKDNIKHQFSGKDIQKNMQGTELASNVGKKSADHATGKLGWTIFFFQI